MQTTERTRPIFEYPLELVSAMDNNEITSLLSLLSHSWKYIAKRKIKPSSILDWVIVEVDSVRKQRESGGKLEPGTIELPSRFYADNDLRSIGEAMHFLYIALNATNTPAAKAFLDALVTDLIGVCRFYLGAYQDRLNEVNTDH